MARLPRDAPSESHKTSMYAAPLLGTNDWCNSSDNAYTAAVKAAMNLVLNGEDDVIAKARAVRSASTAYSAM